MALTKAQVREILSEAGIEKDNLKVAVEKIIDGHLASIDVLREEADTHKAAAEKIQKELDALKAAGDGGWKDKHDKVKKEFDQYKADQDAKAALNAKEKAYRAALKELHISEKRVDTVVRAAHADGVIDGLELEENGAIKGADKLKESIEADWADFIVTVETRGADIAHPPAGVGGGQENKANPMAAKIAAQYHNNLYGELKKE